MSNNDLRAEFIDITPSMAEKWLAENNKHNRKMYEKTTGSYERDMKNDAWCINNQGIGFDVNGNLIDGQHRLFAIVRAQKPVKMLVVTGLPEKQGKTGIPTQETIDGGKGRTVADRLHLGRNMDNANNKVAIANVIAQKIMGRSMKTSADQAYRIIDLYADEIEFIMSGKSTTRGLNYSPVIAAMVFAARVRLDQAVEFKDRYYRGTECSSGHPALTLREFVINKNSIKGGFVNSGSSFRSSIFNGAANALESFCKGRLLKKITAHPHGYEYFFNLQKGCVGMVREWLS